MRANFQPESLTPDDVDNVLKSAGQVKWYIVELGFVKGLMA